MIPGETGTCLAGQALGRALIVDCYRYLKSIRKIDIQENVADVSQLTEEFLIEPNRGDGRPLDRWLATAEQAITGSWSLPC